jgi:uncharacterized damage-inducible protein DinB
VSDLQGLPGIGPGLAAELRAVGIRDAETLRTLGASESARRLAELGFRDPGRSRDVLSAALGESRDATPALPVRDRTDAPAAWDERTTLTAMLDYVRATVRAKCTGLSDADARRAPLPASPLMSMSGLVSHLRWVEYSWFEVVYLGAEDEAPWTEDDPDAEFRLGATVPLEQLLAEYEAQSRGYRDLVASHDLDSWSVGVRQRTGERVTLRWIVMHLIEETARHNGHLDLLRELADGTRGD